MAYNFGYVWTIIPGTWGQTIYEPMWILIPGNGMKFLAMFKLWKSSSRGPAVSLSNTRGSSHKNQ